MKKLFMNRTAWKGFTKNFQALIEQYNDVDHSLLGLSEDWESNII